MLKTGQQSQNFGGGVIIYNIKTKAFTLVELIITITILAILATIAFINLGNYPADSRDAVRKSDLRTIEKAMTIYHIENGRYPTPDKDTVDGKTYFGEKAFKELGKINELPLDPTTGKPYRYISLGVGYILVAELENGELFRVDHSRLAFQTCGMDYNSLANKYGSYQNAPYGTNTNAFTAMKADGTLYSWGISSSGGEGHPTEKGFIKIFPFTFGFLAINPYGKVIYWGSSKPNLPDEEGFIGIYSAGHGDLFLKKIDGKLKNYRLGIEIPQYKQVSSNHGGYAVLKPDGSIISNILTYPRGNGFKKIVSSVDEFTSMDNNGCLKSWGLKGRWNGSDAPSDCNYKKVVSSKYSFTAIDSNGCLKSWGVPGWGGNGNPTDCGYIDVKGDSHGFIAIKSDGTIKSWGAGVLNSLSIPNLKKIYMNGGSFTTLDSSGCLKSWGADYHLRVGAPTDCSFKEVFSYGGGFIGLKLDGTLSFWGHYPNQGPTNISPGNKIVKVFSNGDAFVAMDEKGCLHSGGKPNYGGVNAPPDCGRIEVNGSRVDDLEDCSQM
ncbi:hypothetical protein DLH72_03855 [Candidatus Gracilibacteria bacterium]|nr:MAG: hypothetical protein DLH72_03855 [Candidatus Gracilibacteria bacterium]